VLKVVRRKELRAEYLDLPNTTFIRGSVIPVNMEADAAANRTSQSTHVEYEKILCLYVNIERKALGALATSYHKMRGCCLIVRSAKRLLSIGSL
jgi:hypothetical protein